MADPKSHSHLLPGATLQDGLTHEMDHERWSRRAFIRSVGLAGAGSMLLGQMPVTALSASPLAWLLGAAETDRILVLIRLKGGNDGQNMIIPVHDYSTYKSRRPQIAVPNADILSLSPESGMPKSMEPLLRMWQDGGMKVVHSIGYPEQNLSHFRSSDIWGSASDSAVTEPSGWMGRWLDGRFPDFLTAPPAMPPAVQIGGFGNLLFLNDQNINLSFVVSDPKELADIAQTGQLFDTTNLPACYYGEQLGYLRAVTNSTFRYAGVISAAYNQGKNSETYGPGLGEQLAIVARLIKGNLGTRVYMVTLDGFDNHANQYQTHQNLLKELAGAVRHFFDDLKTGGWHEKVLAMTMSEFGRRLEQNASLGTDHGAAAPLMVFGPGLNGNGFIGKAPKFSDVDQVGNLKFQTDFREVYATVLEQWLCVPGAEVDEVLGRPFNRIHSLGLSCNATPVFEPRKPEAIPMSVAYHDGYLWLEFELPASAPVDVMLFNMQGQQLWKKSLGKLPAGPYREQLGIPANLPAGAQVITVRAGNALGSRKMIR